MLQYFLTIHVVSMCRYSWRDIVGYKNRASYCGEELDACTVYLRQCFSIAGEIIEYLSRNKQKIEKKPIKIRIFNSSLCPQTVKKFVYMYVYVYIYIYIYIYIYTYIHSHKG